MVGMLAGVYGCVALTLCLLFGMDRGEPWPVARERVAAGAASVPPPPATETTPLLKVVSPR